VNRLSEEGLFKEKSSVQGGVSRMSGKTREKGAFGILTFAWGSKGGSSNIGGLFLNRKKKKKKEEQT